MKIAVFATGLRGGGGRSVGVSLVRSLGKVMGPGNVLAFVPPLEDYRDAAGDEGVELVEFTSGSALRRAIWEWTKGRRLAKSWAADWLIGLGNVPVPYGGRSGVLLLDAHAFYPREHLAHLSRRKRTRKRVFRVVLRLMLPRLGLVMAQTALAAARAERVFAVDEVAVIPNAVTVAAGVDRPALLNVALPEGRFLTLTLTRYYRRKGLGTVVEIHRHHPDLLEGTAAIFTLDPEDERVVELMQQVAEAGLQDSVVNIGPVDQSQLRALYEAVDATVLPTKLESFSSSYAESMAFGVPIITSDMDFAHAICGDAALYVDPDDPQAIATAIRDLSQDPELRARLVSAGETRLEEISREWDESAEALQALLETRR